LTVSQTTYGAQFGRSSGPPGPGYGPQWGPSFGEIPSVRAGIRQTIGAIFAKSGTRILAGPSQSSRSSRHPRGQQFGGQYPSTQQQSGQSPWQQQSGQPWGQQRYQTSWARGADLDQVSYAAELDGSNPWRTPVNQRQPFPRTMNGSAKETILDALEDPTINKLFGYCPGGAVALADWVVLHKSSTVVLTKARTRVTQLLQTVSAGPQAIASAQIGVSEAQEINDDQLTAGVSDLSVRYMRLRDTAQFDALEQLRQDATSLSRMLDTRGHTNRQASACIIQAATELVLGASQQSNETMARALTLLGKQFSDDVFTELANYVHPAMAEQTQHDVNTYPTRTREPAMAGAGQRGYGRDRRQGTDDSDERSQL